MPLFSVADIDEFRDMATDLTLHSWCRVERATDTADGSGGYTHAWIAVAQTECNVKTGQSVSDNGMVPVIGEEVGVMIDLPVTIDGQRLEVVPADRIIETEYEGVTYQVIHVDKPGSLGMLQTAYCVRRAV